MSFPKSSRLVLPLMAVLLALAACETVKGAGRDMQDAGETITDTAKDAQN